MLPSDVVLDPTEVDDLTPQSHSQTRRRSIWWRIAWIILWVLALIELALWFHGGPGAAPGAGKPGTGRTPASVVLATAQKGDIPIRLNGLGTVVPLATVTVQAQVSGVLTEIDFQEGQIVKKGDLLVVIDTRPFAIALELAQAQFARDKALLRNAELDLARFEKLIAQNSVARQVYDTQVSLVQQDKATVQLDQAQIDTAKLNLIYCHVIAPVDGRVGLRQVDLGNFVTPSEPNGIVIVTQLQPITVLFTLPEDDLPAIMKRRQTGAVLPVIAFDRSQTTKLASGTLATLDNQIDTTTGQVKLKAAFDNQDESLFPNQFVNAQLLVDTLHDAVVVPAAAVQHGAPGDFVFLLGADGKVAVRTVKLGPADGERVAIESGLAVGDRVVVEGADKLKDGSSVVVGSAGNTAGSTASAATEPTAGGRTHKSRTTAATAP